MLSWRHGEKYWIYECMWFFKPNIFLEHSRNSSGDYNCSWILGFCNCEIWPLASCVCLVCLVGVLRQWWLLSTSCSAVCLMYCNWKGDLFGRRGDDKILSKQTNRHLSNSVAVWAIKIKFYQDEPISPGITELFSSPSWWSSWAKMSCSFSHCHMMPSIHLS